MTDEMIKQKADILFVRNNCDRSATIVAAAIITAASKMSIPGSIISESAVTEELIETYGIKDNQEALNLIGMDSTIVLNTIGYPVNFDEPVSATREYLDNKDIYDLFYKCVEMKIGERQAAKDETPMTM